MRSSVLFCLVPVALCATVSPSLANVTISNAATANMACSSGLCSPTATNAVLNVQDLEAMLASGNTTVTTTGASVQATNIHVNARLTWTAATTLTLDAFRSIEVNAKVAVTGTGVVVLTTNDGGSGGDFACDNGSITFANVSSKLTINETAYTLVNSVASLASAIAAKPSGAYAFAKDYDAKKDGTYASPPIATLFSGSFNGLGNRISNLSISDPTKNAEVGLFAETTGMIANVRLIDESVQGDTSTSAVGGLVGWAEYSAIAHSFITGTASGDITGGLLGLSRAVVVSGSGSAAKVSGVWAGGLIGNGLSSSISDSWATGNVSGSGFVGGLVGLLESSIIKHSWAGGQVSTNNGNWNEGGGLVGAFLDGPGLIERSYASGAVTCEFDCGGLLGYAETDGAQPIKISQSWATGNVSSAYTGGNAGAGGLVGSGYSCEIGAGSGCEILNSYATGTVSGWAAGGLVGVNGYPDTHSISTSYASGAVASTQYAGGLIGFDCYTYHSLIKRTYWDTTTSGITNRSQGAGNIANDPGIKGLSDAKLKSGLPKGFNPKIWAEDANINNGLPYLINNPPVN